MRSGRCSLAWPTAGAFAGLEPEAALASLAVIALEVEKAWS